MTERRAHIDIYEFEQDEFLKKLDIPHDNDVKNSKNYAEIDSLEKTLLNSRIRVKVWRFD